MKKYPPPASQWANFSFTYLLCYFCLKLLLIKHQVTCYCVKQHATTSLTSTFSVHSPALCLNMKKTSCLIAKLCNYLPFLTPLITDRQAPTGVSALMYFIDLKQWVIKRFIFIWLLWIELIGRPKTKTGLVTLLTSFQTKRKTVWSIYLNQFIWLPSAFISWADLQLWLISRSFIPLEWLQRTQGCPSSHSQLNQKVIQLNRDEAARGF